MLLFLTVTAVILSIIILSIDFNVFFSIRFTANGGERVPNHEMLGPLYAALTHAMAAEIYCSPIGC
jgi:hypothetical protein